MQIINLKDYYPALYAHDSYCAVPNELKDLLDQFILEEYRYYAKRRYHRAFYSIEALNGIEKDILIPCPSLDDLYEQKERLIALYTALIQLPDTQLRRLYAHYYLGMSKAQIARMDGVDESCIRKSIKCGLDNLRRDLIISYNKSRK